MIFENDFCCEYFGLQLDDVAPAIPKVVLGGPVSRYMTVFIFCMHNRVLTTFSTDRERKNCSRLTNNAIYIAT